jgi:hypothetical protein
MRELGTDAILRWTVHPAARGHLEYMHGDWPCEPAPFENQVIKRDFLVDPVSKRSVAARVMHVLRLDKEKPAVFSILVKPAE